MHALTFPPDRAFLERLSRRRFRVIRKEFDEAKGKVVKKPIHEGPLARRDAVTVKRRHNWPGLNGG